MKLLGTAITASVLATAASAHGTADSPVAPPNLTSASVVDRLAQLGYDDVRIVGQTDDAVDVELGRSGQRYQLTVSRKLVGPGSLATTDVAQVVERRLQPLGPPGIVRPTGPVVPR